MKILWILTTLLSVPLIAAEPADSQPAPATKVEDSMSQLMIEAEKGDAYSQRQLYLRYALKGKRDQAAAWADKLINSLTEKGQNGDSAAMWMLARLFLKGDDVVPADAARSIDWFNRLSATGDPVAAYILGDLYTRQNKPETAASAYAKAYGIYSDKATTGDKDAMYWQGYMQLHGLGCQANAAQGIDLLEKAAAAGVPQAAYQLFSIYTKGTGTPADETKALIYATQLADQEKDARMAYVVADAYLKGKGIPADQARGMKYLDLAVAARVPDALYHKAWLLQEQGQAEPALDAYRAAAQQGHADAAVKAGSMLLFGTGIEADPAEGLKILQYADSALESPLAPYELGRYYDSVDESALADEYYISASDRGHPAAMARRGLLHLSPMAPVNWNPTATYHWWKTGADAGDPTCTLYLRIYLFGFVPLLLILLFGLPLYFVHHLARRRQEEKE